MQHDDEVKRSALRRKLSDVLQEVRLKNSPITISEMKELLYTGTAVLLKSDKVRRTFQVYINSNDHPIG